MDGDDGLAGFLRARLDEDEATAWAVHDVTKCDALLYEEDLPGAAARTPDCDCGYPARVLREVEAKRKRLVLYLDAKETFASALKDAPPGGDPATAHSYVRERVNVNQASGRFTALEVSVRLDAAVWDGHPDFRPEWRP